MGKKWTQEQKDAASAAYADRNEGKKTSSKREAMRVPVGGRRDITAVHSQDTDEYKYRWVNDKDNRLETFRTAGYEHVESAKVGDSHVDGTHTESGVVSRDMGKGTNSFLMKQRLDYFNEDKTAKQKIVDETEESMRRKPGDNRDDGQYGEIKIG